LLLYVSATETAVSALLVQEQETNHSKQQVPVYYVSEALSGSKSYYFEKYTKEFQCTNNIAEYEAFLLGLRKAKAMGIQRLIIKIDSQIVAGHIKKDYKARDPELARYLQFLKDQEKHIECFTVKATQVTSIEVHIIQSED
jgi:ribonuclease HI